MDTSLHLIPPLGEVISLIGDKVRGAGWYGHTTGLHSVAIRVLNFQGRIKIQATIATTPAEADWYSVLPNDVAYLQYPQPDYVFLPGGFGGETSTSGFNFASNAVWVRAIVERDYLMPAFNTSLGLMPFGTVQYILVNY
jgi:hypothetical protein